jgi:hypothetical protein
MTGGKRIKKPGTALLFAKFMPPHGGSIKWVFPYGFPYLLKIALTYRVGFA